MIRYIDTFTFHSEISIKFKVPELGWAQDYVSLRKDQSSDKITVISEKYYYDDYILNIRLKTRVSVLLSAIITLSIVMISMMTMSQGYNLIEGAATVKTVKILKVQTQ